MNKTFSFYLEGGGERIVFVEKVKKMCFVDRGVGDNELIQNLEGIFKYE